MTAWTSIRPPVRGSIIVVLVAALVLGLTAAGKYWFDQAGRVDPGRLPDSVEVVGTGGNVAFEIPGGRVNVSIETDQRTLRDDNDKRHEAPSGGRLVQASWSNASDSETGHDPLAGLEPDQLPDPKVWVRSGDQRERVTGTNDGISGNAEGGAFAFATRDPLVVELEFAGRRQSIDVASGRRKAGSFAPLYRPQPIDTDSEPIISHRKGDVRWSSLLTYGQERVPYLRDLGWAKKGREWLVLRKTEYRVDDFKNPGRREDGYYEVAGTEPSANVEADGGRLVRKPRQSVEGGTSSVRHQPTGAVFDIPRGKATALRFTIKLRLKPGEDGASSKALTATRVERLSAVPEGGERR